MTKEYDLVILGGGTGGYVSAIRASQLGMTVALVEAKKLGGTCLHEGCIPSKTLLRSAEIYRQTKEASNFGIEVGTTSINFLKVQERKDKVISRLHQGVQSLMKKNRIDVFKGYGRILGPSIFSPMPGTISIEYANGEENTMIVPKNVIIATGSQPKMLTGLKTDGIHVLSSDEALRMDKLPQSIIIIGAGAIGVEWASMLADFEVDVTVLEYADQILPSEDKEISKEVEKLLKNKHIKFIKNALILTDTLLIDKGVSINAEVNGEKQLFSAEKMLISVGREASIADIGLNNTNIEIDKEFIKTNKFYQTKESHIYAIGDAVGGKQLAHVASREGIIAIEHIANKNPLPLDYSHVPSCTYSSPEVASIGLTEEQALKSGINIKVGKFPFNAIGKALVNGLTDGFVKVITNKDNDDLVGIHMVGEHVTELISEAGIAKVLDATAWEISQSIHPHPTLSEILGEASLAIEGIQIHY